MRRATVRGAPPVAAGGAPLGATTGHSKKNSGHHCHTVRQRFERVKTMSAEYPVNVLCATLDVSPSGYHAWAQRTPSLRAQANAALLPLIAEAYRTSRQTYGSPRITHWLRAHDQPCGRVRVARLMRQGGGGGGGPPPPRPPRFAGGAKERAPALPEL